jgi:hypothetical protein
MVVEIFKKNVFMVSGTSILEGEGDRKTNAVISQVVVVAVDDVAAYDLLRDKRPDFVPVGHASLAEYEAAVARLRAVLGGGKSDLPLFVAPDMSM